MKKIYCLLMTFVFAIALMQTASAGITTIGTIEYENQIQKTLSGNVTLELIHAQMPRDTIQATRMSYEAGATVYKFTSKLIREPDWRMMPEEKSYLYQDKNTGQLYKVIIDFSSIDIDANPDAEKYAKMKSDFEKLQVAYMDVKLDLVKARNKTEKVEKILTNKTGQMAILNDKYDYEIGVIETLKKEKEQAINNGYVNLIVAFVGTATICYVFFNKKAKKLIYKPENMLRSESIDNYSRKSRIVDNEINRGGLISNVTELTRKAIKRAQPPPIKKQTTPVVLKPKGTKSTLSMPMPTEYMSPAVKAEYDELKRIEKERSGTNGIWIKRTVNNNNSSEYNR